MVRIPKNAGIYFMRGYICRKLNAQFHRRDGNFLTLHDAHMLRTYNEPRFSISVKRHGLYTLDTMLVGIPSEVTADSIQTQFFLFILERANSLMIEYTLSRVNAR